MASNSKAKMKILYLLQILQEETDAEHGLTMSQILDRLNEYGISAERKSIYADINVLREFDVDIRTYQRNPVEYAIERRDFTLGELMLMVDAIQSCRAITDGQAKKLITNIKTLATNREQQMLNRRIHVVGRIKTKNESVFGTVDRIHEAMRLRCKVSFFYKKALSPAKEHCVTPVGIAYDDGFYYMTAWDPSHDDMAEFRLDRMNKVVVCNDVPADQNKHISDYCFTENNAISFGRFKGNELTVTLVAPADKIEIITDRFGSAAKLSKGKDGEIKAYAKVCKSEQFFGWIAGMGKTVRIVAPKGLVKEYREYLAYLLED